MSNYKRANNDTTKSNKYVMKDVPVYYTNTSDLSEDVFEEVENTLKSIPFNRISIPLNAYREDVFEDEEGNKKSVTIGFIKSFNPKALTFNVIIFDTFKSAIKKFDSVGLEVNFGVWKDHLSRINRLSLINVDTDEDSEDEESTVEQTEDAE